MKAYTLGIHGFSTRVLVEALELPGHIRQVSTLIVAANKKDAAELAHACWFGRPSMSDSEFRIVSGNPHSTTAALMAYAGDRPMVFAYPFDSHDGAPVVAIDDAGPRVVGHLHRLQQGSYALTFVPLDGVA